MRGIFQQVFNLSVAGSYLILAVMALRLLLRKAPRNMICVLWILAGLRLLLPISIESSLGMLPSGNVITDSTEQEGLVIVDTGFDRIDQRVNRQIRGNYEIEESPADFHFLDLCGSVWLAGMVVLGGYFIRSWQKLRKRISTAVPEEGWGEKVYLCDEIETPFLMGIIYPRIYLPAGMDEETVPYVIAHEKAHKDRKDHLVKYAASLILIVYWFHPLIWLSYFLLSRDIEFACDERVIRQMGTAHKKSYSGALLSCSTGRRSVLWCPAAFGEVGVKSRIVKVLHYKKPALWVIIAAAVLILLTTVCFSTQRRETLKEGSVLSYGGCEFILKEAIACEETDFMKLAVNIRSDGRASEAAEREYAGLVCAGITGTVGSTEAEEDIIQFTTLGIYNQAVEDALTLWLGPGGAEIGAFSSDLVEYEQAEEYLVDSVIGQIRVLVSPHSMKIICQDGIPDKKDGGILAAEMKNGKIWKISRIPLWLGESKSDIEFNEEWYFSTAAMDEEKGWIFYAFEEPVSFKDVQAFIYLPE